MLAVEPMQIPPRVHLGYANEELILKGKTGAAARGPLGWVALGFACGSQGGSIQPAGDWIASLDGLMAGGLTAVRLIADWLWPWAVIRVVWVGRFPGIRYHSVIPALPVSHP